MSTEASEQMVGLLRSLTMDVVTDARLVISLMIGKDYGTQLRSR
jgi:hypothetical protein